MAIMRTVKEAINELKEIDPNTALTENYLRTLLHNDRIPHKRAGNKFLINMEHLYDYLDSKDDEAV